MQKAKKFDWKDTNVEKFGSDEDRQVKKASAQTEPAWKGAGEKVGLQIWRINKFKVEFWPQEDYGKFYNGDSYIILNTYKEKDSEALLYDVHFWIGAYSTQDEYGTAAYKTVELDTLLDDKPVQHRECERFESSLFKSYFNTITILKGGVDSGFNHVEPSKYIPRLLHFHGGEKIKPPPGSRPGTKVKKTCVEVKEVRRCKKSIDNSDVYIIDNGADCLLWVGACANKDEEFQAVQYMQQLKAERHGKCTVTTLKKDDGKEYTKPIDDLPDDVDDDDDEEKTPEPDENFPKTLFRLSDASGKMEFTKVAEGTITEDQLDPNDAFIADTGKELFVWIGRGASCAERKNALTYAKEYLNTTCHPLISISVIAQDDCSRSNAAFGSILD